MIDACANNAWVFSYPARSQEAAVPCALQGLACEVWSMRAQCHQRPQPGTDADRHRVPPASKQRYERHVLACALRKPPSDITLGGRPWCKYGRGGGLCVKALRPSGIRDEPEAVVCRPFPSTRNPQRRSARGSITRLMRQQWCLNGIVSPPLDRKGKRNSQWAQVVGMLDRVTV